MLIEGSLTTPETLAKELGLVYDDLTQVEKDNIDVCINVATEKIEFFCNRKFKLQEHTYVDEINGTKLVLPVFPIVEINNTSPELDFDTDIQRYNSGVINLNAAGKGLTEITYTAGWKLPSEEDRDLPYTIELAAIKLAASGYKSIGKIISEQKIKSEKSFDYSYSVFEVKGSMSFSYEITNLLEQWVIKTC